MGSCYMLAVPEFLWLLVVGDCRAATLAAFVLAPLELADNEIGLHLELRDAAIKIFIALFAESRLGLQFKAGKHAAILKDIHDRLVAALDQFVIPCRVKVISVPAGICKAGEPFPGNESGLVIKV